MNYRVVIRRYNRKIVTTRDFCQVFRLRITLVGKARMKAGNETRTFARHEGFPPFLNDKKYLGNDER
jgi:hypothetical protein